LLPAKDVLTFRVGNRPSFMIPMLITTSHQLIIKELRAIHMALCFDFSASNLRTRLISLRMLTAGYWRVEALNNYALKHCVSDCKTWYSVNGSSELPRPQGGASKTLKQF
jgi:hypothetical protein